MADTEQLEKSEKKGKPFCRFRDAIFWLGVAIGFTVSVFAIGGALFIRHRRHSTAIVVKHEQPDVNKSFPSISICQVFNGEKNWDLSEQYYGEDRDKRIDDFLTEISYFTGACYTCEMCGDDIDCPKNFTKVANDFRESCGNLIQNCTWNGEPFECCEGFLPLATEFGTCYSINSALTVPRYGLDLLYNRERIFGKLKMMITEDAQLFVHHPNDIPYTYGESDLKDTMLMGSTKDMVIKVSEQTTVDTLKAVPIKQRKCRFSWENDPTSAYDRYSFSTCQTNCYNTAQFNMCNCTNHLMPRNPHLNIPQCDFKGLICLTENFMKISELRKNCPFCLPSCEKYDYKTIYNSIEEMENEDGTDIAVSMIAVE